jgi:hypothetical protein
MGFLDRFKKRASHDESSIREMLEARGATPAEAQELVDLLRQRLSPDDMHAWLAHPKKAHAVPDPESAKQFEDAGLVGTPLNWTPINAISAGKTSLVVDEARRYVAGID